MAVGKRASSQAQRRTMQRGFAGRRSIFVSSCEPPFALAKPPRRKGSSRRFELGGIAVTGAPL